MTYDFDDFDDTMQYLRLNREEPYIPPEYHDPIFKVETLYTLFSELAHGFRQKSQCMGVHSDRYRFDEILKEYEKELKNIPKKKESK